MKKALNITIANTLFYIEEDAFEALDSYLKRIRAHFSKLQDRDEIVADIEARIAEKFTAKKHQVVTMADVTEVIAAMGETSEFDDSAATEPGPAARVEKKLYRNTDDAIIAGVASGIASYLGIDSVIVRAIFVASVLFGGTGVIAYIILWIVMPEAKTASDKLMMQGAPVTLDSVSKFVKEQADEVRERTKSGSMKRAAALPAEIIRRIFTFLTKRIFPLVGGLIGALIAIGASIAIIALFVGFFSAIFNYPSPNIDFPLGEAVDAALLYALLVSGLFAIAIPIVFILTLGISLVRRKNTFTSRTNFALLAVWFIALIILGTAAVRAGALHDEYIRTAPAYQAETKAFDVQEFTKLDVSDNQRVVLVQSTTTSVTAEGRQRDLEYVDVIVQDGTLVVQRKSDMRICFFCFHDSVSIRVAVPAIEAVSLSNSSRIEGDGIIALDSLELDLSNSSRAELKLNLANTLNAKLSNSSRAVLTGSANVLRTDLGNSSSLDALRLEANAAHIVARNSSRADINAALSLDVIAENSSRVNYVGSPSVTHVLRNSSRLAGPATSTESEMADFDEF